VRGYVIIKTGERCVISGILVRERVDENPKVVIVPFLSLFFEFQPFVITLI